MNEHKLYEMKYRRVRVRPITRRIDPNGIALLRIDDEWMLTHATREEINLQNLRTQHNVQVGTGHVREYMTGIGRKAGFLILKSQIFLFVRGVTVEPLAEDERSPDSLHGACRTTVRDWCPANDYRFFKVKRHYLFQSEAGKFISCALSIRSSRLRAKACKTAVRATIPLKKAVHQSA
jgi:hypothetical protein